MIGYELYFIHKRSTLFPAVSLSQTRRARRTPAYCERTLDHLRLVVPANTEPVVMCNYRNLVNAMHVTVISINNSLI